MTKATKLSMAVTGILVLLISAVTGTFGFMMWALALNGFMGQERAVNVSMISYIVLAALSALLAAVLSVAAVYLLAGRRGWNAAGSAISSVIVFATAGGALHFLCVIISAVVADQMRTTR